MRREKKLKPLFLLLVFLLFFSSLNSATMVEGETEYSLCINEIGAYLPSDEEFIELFNYGDSAVNLTGWKFIEGFTGSNPGGIKHGLREFQGGLVIGPEEYAVIANKADVFLEANPGYTGILIDSSWTSLREEGEKIELMDETGRMVESFDYPPAPDFSLERIDPLLRDYSYDNWVQHESGHTAGYENSVYLGREDGEEDTSEEEQQEDEGGGTDMDDENSEEEADDESGEEGEENEEDVEDGGGSSDEETFIIKPGDVVINELVSDPASGGAEWIELFNNLDREIDLAGWVIEEGSEAQTKLEGAIGSGESDRYLVVEKPKGNLNNSGDIVFLKSAEGDVIDRVTYGNWDDGNLNDNAPAAKKPHSLARAIDGEDTDNDFNDFKETALPTKGGRNIIIEPEKNQGSAETSSKADNIGEAAESVLAYDYSGDIKINELFPNPEGSDLENEFIELYNAGGREVKLKGWALKDNSAKKFIFSEQHAIQPRGYLAVYRKESGIALNNSGTEGVYLFQPMQGEYCEMVEYSGAVEEGVSYIKHDDAWRWTTVPTPGGENILLPPNHAPIAVIDCPGEVYQNEEFSCDGSDSSDEDGDNLSYLWSFSGQEAEGREVKHIFNKKGKFEVKLIVSDGERQSSAKIKIVVIESEVQVLGEEFFKVYINELLPNPEGKDDGEWIELYNPHNSPVDLSGWKLDDSEGGSRPYTIPEGTIIEAKGYLLFMREETGLALNNTVDAVRLFDPLGGAIDEIEYADVREGESLAKSEAGEWVWTIKLTPGARNIIEKRVESGNAGTGKKSGVKIKPIIETDLKGAREQDLGDSVKVRGLVSVLPGTFSTQFFYLAGSGMQVYYSKKDFPEMAIGDLVEATGVLSEVQGEMRIKIAQKEDLAVIESQSPPEPYEASLNEIGETLEGFLVKVKGLVVEIKGANIYLDDGTDEARVYIKQSTKINKKVIKEGDEVEIIGIVSQNNSGYQILPRNQNDIILANSRGESLPDEKVDLNGDKERAKRYLVLAGVLLLFLLGAYLARKYIKKSN